MSSDEEEKANKGEGLEFDKLMKDAVAIKSAQMSKLRRKFDSWPQFH